MAEYILALKTKVDCTECRNGDKQVIYTNDISNLEMCLACAKKKGLKAVNGMDVSNLTVVKAKIWGTFLRRLTDFYYKSAHLDFMKGGRLKPNQFMPKTPTALVQGVVQNSKDMRLLSWGSERIEVHYAVNGRSFVFLVEGSKDVETFLYFAQQYLDCGHKNDTFEFDKVWW